MCVEQVAKLYNPTENITVDEKLVAVPPNKIFLVNHRNITKI